MQRYSMRLKILLAILFMAAIVLGVSTYSNRPQPRQQQLSNKISPQEVAEIIRNCRASSFVIAHSGPFLTLKSGERFSVESPYDPDILAAVREADAKGCDYTRGVE